jgi:NAD kinase
VSKPSKELLPYVIEAISCLRDKHGLEVVLEPQVVEELKNSFNVYANTPDLGTSPSVDFVIALGGDGLLMHTSTLFNSYGEGVLALLLRELTRCPVQLRL